MTETQIIQLLLISIAVQGLALIGLARQNDKLREQIKGLQEEQKLRGVYCTLITEEAPLSPEELKHMYGAPVYVVSVLGDGWFFADDFLIEGIAAHPEYGAVYRSKPNPII